MRPQTSLSLASLCLSAAAIAAPSATIAQDGLYISGLGGLNLFSDADFSYGPLDGFGGEADYAPGFMIGGAAGYAFDASGDPDAGLAFRPELEITYRRNSLDSVTEVGGRNTGTFTDVDGNISNLGMMANGWVDYRFGDLTPYVGFGIGASYVNLNDIEYAGADIADDSDFVFAYQVGVGAAYAINSNIDLTVGYRFFATLDAAFETSETIPAESIDDAENANHTMLLGVRYNF